MSETAAFTLTENLILGKYRSDFYLPLNAIQQREAGNAAVGSVTALQVRFSDLLIPVAYLLTFFRCP